MVEVAPRSVGTTVAAPLELVASTRGVPVSIKEGAVPSVPAVRRPAGVDDKGQSAGAPPAEVTTEPAPPVEPTAPVDDHPAPPDPATPPKDDEQPPAGEDGGNDDGGSVPKHQPVQVDIDSDTGSVSASVDVSVIPPVTVVTPPLADLPVVGGPVSGAVGGVIKLIGGKP